MLKRAIISVFDKTGIEEFANGLIGLGVEIISTGGTARALREAGIKVMEVSDLTGFPECLDGRVKTLHPKVHGGILAIRDKPEHMDRIKELGIETIDIVVINLYPFKRTILNERATLEDAIENIDIGGPAMLRSAAKNYQDVIVIIDPFDYDMVLEALRENGDLLKEERLSLSQKVFSHTANYDAMISTYLKNRIRKRAHSVCESNATVCQGEQRNEGLRLGAAPEAESMPASRAESMASEEGSSATHQAGSVPSEEKSSATHEKGSSAARDSGLYDKLFTVTFEKDFDMRYGENPHQTAAFYKDPIPVAGTLASAEKIHGKELSYNNINDADGALELLREFDEPAAVAVKHATPCGVAVGDNVFVAYKAARDSDTESIYGGIVAVNRRIDIDTAKEMSKIFLEVIIAPGFDPDAFEILAQKKNIRLLKLDTDVARERYKGLKGEDEIYFKKIGGGLLTQTVNTLSTDKDRLTVVTKKGVSQQELADLLFAMKVAKHAKSNSIVLAKDLATVGIGSGQTSRIKALRDALENAKEKADGSVMASEAFFPFGDCVEVAAKCGVKAIIQPGGSKNDNLSVEKCDEYGIAMVFTGIRHFKH
ncbi:MAG: bifunctional phosphoribosylaminoimidazolecarboxamide formyltransferase/IMP cyclohydrolase [Oscillospiraceae bacterium]|nr:bifunctional phosphoribosylaminoimidazolecarboxamide formyltransferase/IMP cyclohydrolase [Oscillospiraceae bacterium]